MPVDSKHSEVSSNLDQWTQNRDCVKGSKVVKSKRTKYLPMPMADDTSKENKDRYTSYLLLANYVNFTGSTEEGMLGMIFRKPMITELVAQVDYLSNNANGFGITLDQMARSIISNLLQTGREGILVDYPAARAGLSRQEVARLNLQAKLLPYRAENIINWRTEVVNNVKKLSMVVLLEPKEVIADDGFTSETKNYYRVLLLKDGVYVQNVYNEKSEQVFDDDGNGDIVPRKSNGTVWNEIPFVFIGSTNNDEKVDKAPLTDISDINIAHYRNSADWEDSSHMVGQPTPYASGFTQQWVEEVLKGKDIVIGSRAFLLLPEGASAGLLQAQANTMPAEGMTSKEKQIIMVGAHLITDAKGNETAEAAKIRFAGQTSKLGVLVGNVEAGLIQAINFAMEFMGGVGDFRIALNKDFYDKTVDPQLVMAQIQLLDRGVIALPDFRDNLRTNGIIDTERTDEQITADADDNVMGNDFEQ